ncbi:MAG: hypothetical protein KAV45_07080, partial [Calditrichia bacterium]|nr:hypothetical protein [Calditrichia bacterium]
MYELLFGDGYYDPEIPRWFSVDPLANKKPGLTPYNYVQNNSLLRIDPFGLTDDPAWKIPGISDTHSGRFR